MRRFPEFESPMGHQLSRLMCVLGFFQTYRECRTERNDGMRLPVKRRVSYPAALCPIGGILADTSDLSSDAEWRKGSSPLSGTHAWLAERSIAAVLKTAGCNRSVGSNPTPRARRSGKVHIKSSGFVNLSLDMRPSPVVG